MTPDTLHDAAVARVTALATLMGTQLPMLTRTLHKVLAESIEDLQGDQLIVELLGASIESNVETVAHILQYDVDVDKVATPFAAEEYARRLAQRGIAPLALVRAYRLGQQQVLDWAFDELDRDADATVALAAGRIIVDTTFRYIDRISEQVVSAYESERVRWLANRNTVRKAMIEELLRGDQVDLAAAEGALSYRLRQNHVGVVLWSTSGSTGDESLRQLERLLQQAATAAGCSGQPLFVPRDRSTGWGWIPLGRSHSEIMMVGDDEGDHWIAVGSAAAGADGFRVTHLEALRAQQVALAARDRAERVTAFSDPQVRTAAMMAADLEGTRRLVQKALGPLAADTEAAARLRETLQVFLTEKGSYLATADRIHLHKNTVKYRIDKALEERGRPLDDERLELELALVACRWLAGTVLLPAPL
ncbi:PucR family transcriptional regulator [Kribbella kalugense]|uniref:DNA-binding PucR family transcriptional regulator n=1 Tax=Kribbella kalugense TaxID=2512221 RepID=A0A4R7ZW39_9ACTN|nr:helix-turn-helix domain-containing protein [Kribbella kalugense]TDW21935.1 DNA-binding PucR family transcriptional regulator [Kribbella kalugense]